MGFPKQEYWSGLPFPSPGDLPDPGIKPGSLALAGRFFTTEPPGKSLFPLLELKLAISRHRTRCSHQLWEISQQAIPQSYWIKRKHPGKSGLCLQRCLPLPLAFYLGFHSISLLKQKSILKARKPHVGWEGFRLEYISNFSENSHKWKENQSERKTGKGQEPNQRCTGSILPGEAMQLKLQNETQVWAYVLLLSWTLSKEMRTISVVEPPSLGFFFGGGGGVWNRLLLVLCFFLVSYSSPLTWVGKWDSLSWLWGWTQVSLG